MARSSMSSPTSLRRREARVSRFFINRPIVAIVISLLTVIVGGLLIKESRHVKIWDEVGGHEEEPEYDTAQPRPAVT